MARLRATEEAWARAIIELPADGDLVAQVRESVERGMASAGATAAAQHLAAAERWQWEMGTWASGAGEGLSSMFEVRTLQLAQAWLLAVGAPADAAAAAEVRRLAKEVAEDPNDVAARYRPHVTALLGRLSS